MGQGLTFLEILFGGRLVCLVVFCPYKYLAPPICVVTPGTAGQRSAGSPWINFLWPWLNVGQVVCGVSSRLMTYSTEHVWGASSRSGVTMMFWGCGKAFLLAKEWDTPGGGHQSTPFLFTSLPLVAPTLIRKMVSTAIHAQWPTLSLLPPSKIYPLATDCHSIVRIFGWTLCHPP